MFPKTLSADPDRVGRGARYRLRGIKWRGRMNFWMRNCCAAAALASVAATTPAMAGDLGIWWPLKVMDASSGTDVPAEYSPLPKAEKAYTLCVLFPHLKDSFWLAVDYGIVEEARRTGVNMN